MSRRSGFTLVEVLAAIAITGLALSGAVALLAQLSDGSERIVRESLRAAREGNGARVLDRLLLNARTTTDSTKQFRGDENGVELWTLCDQPGGWAEVCRVTVSIDQRGDSSVLLAGVGSDVIAGRRQRGRAVLRYYRPSATSDTVWVREWASNLALPVAIGLIAGGDTVVFPVGSPRE